MNFRKQRKKGTYFERREGDPAPLSFQTQRRVLFSDADPMGVLWHGRYPAFFETAAAELHRLCGLGYLDFQHAGILAPIVQLHVDYMASAFLEEEVTVRASMVWNDAARIDTEYAILKADGRLAARGYTIQLFTLASTGEPLFTLPGFVEATRLAWRNDELSHLQ